MNHICILTLNRPEKLKRCLESIKPALRFKGKRIHVWILNQQTTSIIPDLPIIPGLHQLYRLDNRGCAGGRKLLVQSIEREFGLLEDDTLIFLDDDLYAINDTWLDALVAPILAGEADITGVEGMRITPSFMTTPDQVNPDYVSGGWCAISAKVFLAGIMFDTDFNPNYWEDVDLNFSARAAGFRIKAVGDIGLVHEPHPNPVNDAIFLASRLTFIKKWGQRQ